MAGIKKLHDPEKKYSTAGFTLVEAALVILVGGALLTVISSYILNILQKEQIAVTQYRITAIQQALSVYLTENGAYPCPASLTEPIDTSSVINGDTITYGMDVTVGYGPLSPNYQNCSHASPAESGTYRVGASGSLPIRIGTVPVRNIGLPDEYMNDGWNDRFVYAVTEIQASGRISGGYTPYNGAIGINDQNGNAIVSQGSAPQPNAAHYILISPGPDHNGAFTAEGGQVPCNAAEPDHVNCPTFPNPNGIFLQEPTTGGNVANLFNDIIVYYGPGKGFATGIPSGAATIFSTKYYAVCPIGWTAVSLTLQNEQVPPIDPGKYMYCQKQ